jgi:hypothetical protein
VQRLDAGRGRPTFRSINIPSTHPNNKTPNNQAKTSIGYKINRRINPREDQPARKSTDRSSSEKINPQEDQPTDQPARRSTDRSSSEKINPREH